jgi:predicted nuclease of predicted toxin-antitoxin system
LIRVLVDMNLAPKWAQELGAHGIDAVHWSSVGAPDASDKELFSWADVHGHIVLTCDLDFTHLLALTGAKGPSVVLLRARDTTVGNLAKRVVAVLQDHAHALAQGALVVVDETKSRVQILPLRAKPLQGRGR